MGPHPHTPWDPTPSSVPQLLNVAYGYDHGTAATLGGLAQGGSVVGLLYIGNTVYKQMAPDGARAPHTRQPAPCP
jgi:hypothetical protein